LGIRTGWKGLGVHIYGGSGRFKGVGFRERGMEGEMVGGWDGRWNEGWNGEMVGGWDGGWNEGWNGGMEGGKKRGMEWGMESGMEGWKKRGMEWVELRACGLLFSNEIF